MLDFGGVYRSIARFKLYICDYRNPRDLDPMFVK